MERKKIYFLSIINEDLSKCPQQMTSVNIFSEEENVCTQHVKLSLSIRYTYTYTCLSFPQARSVSEDQPGRKMAATELRNSV